MATFTTFIAWSLMNHGLSFWAAFPDRARDRVRRRCGDRAHRDPTRRGCAVLTIVIVTLGLALLLNGLMSVIWGGANRQFRRPVLDADDRRRRRPDQRSGHRNRRRVVRARRPARRCSSASRSSGSALRAAAVNPRFVAARRHSRRLDARARLGDRGGARRGCGDDDRPGRLPRSEHDADDPAVRVRGGSARRARQPDRRGRRWDLARRHHHAARPLRRLHRLDAEAAGGAAADPRRCCSCGRAGSSAGWR